MTLPGWIRKNINFVTVGFVLTIVFGILPLYLTRERKPALVFEVTNDVNVYDVRTPIRDLRISFRGEDVEGQNLGLRILVLKVQNTGGADILQGHYDSNEDWGFKVVGGRLVEVRLTDSNSTYLKRRITPVVAGNSVMLDRVIFERGKFVTFEVLILHPRDVRSEIEPFGKIAGIDAFQSISAIPGAGPTLSQRSFSGPLAVQAIRLVVYFLGFILTIAALFLLGVGITRVISFPSRYRRRRVIRGILDPIEDPQVRTALEHAFVESGRTGLESMSRLLADRDMLKGFARNSREVKRRSDLRTRSEMRHVQSAAYSDAQVVVTATGTMFAVSRTVEDLTERGLLKVDESSGEVQISPALNEALTLALKETTPKGGN